MRTITITPKKAFRISVEAENISPDKFASLNIEQIKSLTVWQGNRKMMLSDLFTVEGDDAPATAEETTIRLAGDFFQVKRIGEGMTCGTGRGAGKRRDARRQQYVGWPFEHCRKCRRLAGQRDARRQGCRHGKCRKLRRRRIPGREVRHARRRDRGKRAAREHTWASIFVEAAFASAAMRATFPELPIRAAQSSSAAAPICPAQR